MSSRKKVLITVNPDLVAGRRLSTIRSVVTALDAICDLSIVPIDSYDFSRGLVCAYRRVRCGRFEKMGMVKPQGALWIVYSDGYWLDHQEHGFKRRDEFLQAQICLHEDAQNSAAVTRVVNSPQAERNCLKSWMAGLDRQNFKTVPTYLATQFSEVHDLFCQHGTIVAKPNWGGSGFGVKKIASDNDIKVFQNFLEDSQSSLAEYCFQNYVSGAEKRLWYVNGQCVAARITHGRHTPWSADTEDFRVASYDASTGKEFENDLSVADRLCRQSLLSIGSVDFIGGLVNEINGAGTTFTQYDGFKKIVDARKPLVDYLLSLAGVGAV